MGGRLELIIGCMFSQKTTRMIERIRKHRFINKETLILTHGSDTRYGMNKIISHDLVHVDAYPMTTLMDIIDDKNDMYYKILNADSVFIEESQFFDDIGEFVRYLVDTLGKYVCVCGLDGDYKRMPFANVVNLIPFADDVIKCYALCQECRDGTRAAFTRRKNASSCRLEVGADDIYEPVCREHFV